MNPALIRGYQFNCVFSMIEFWNESAQYVQGRISNTLGNLYAVDESIENRRRLQCVWNPNRERKTVNCLFKVKRNTRFPMLIPIVLTPIDMTNVGIQKQRRSFNWRNERLGKRFSRTALNGNRQLVMGYRWVFIYINKFFDRLRRSLTGATAITTPTPPCTLLVSAIVTRWRFAASTVRLHWRLFHESYRCASGFCMLTINQGPGAMLPLLRVNDSLLDCAPHTSVFMPFTWPRPKVGRGRAQSPRLDLIWHRGEYGHVAFFVNTPIVVASRVNSITKKLAYRYYATASTISDTPRILGHFPPPFFQTPDHKPENPTLLVYRDLPRVRTSPRPCGGLP